MVDHYVPLGLTQKLRKEVVEPIALVVAVDVDTGVLIVDIDAGPVRAAGELPNPEVPVVH